MKHAIAWPDTKTYSRDDVSTLPEARGGFLDGGRFEGYAASREDHEKVAEAAGKGANSSLVAATESQIVPKREKNLDSKNEVNHMKIILVIVCFSQI